MERQVGLQNSRLMQQLAKLQVIRLRKSPEFNSSLRQDYPVCQINRLSLKDTLRHGEYAAGETKILFLFQKLEKVITSQLSVISAF